MSTIQEFENAPVGATARRPGSPVAVKVSYRPTTKGNWDDGLVKMTPETLVDYDYVLDPSPAPTTVQEALELAWNLGHPVKEGQVIPDGTKWMKKVGGHVQEATMTRDYTVTANDTFILRTHEPLPDPLPDWLDAPAVLAAMDDCSWQKVWLPSRIGRWRCTCCGVDRHWSKMNDVTPLWPEGEKE